MTIKDKQPLNILVIEDNDGDFVLIQDYLEEQIAYPNITRGVSFAEAERMIKSKETPFHVVLLDLSLPDKTVSLIITEILALVQNIPVIILTGYTDIEFSIKSIAQGISDYLIKDELNALMLYKSILYCLERKKRSAQLKESEKKYSSLFHLSPQPMWVYNPENLQFVQINHAAKALYGYTDEEFLSMTILDIRPKNEAEKLALKLPMLLENKKNHRGLYKHQKKNGDLIDVEIISTSVTVEENELRMVIVNDVTEKLSIENQITKAIIKTQEDERFEIGCELHDNVCQLLTVAQISAGAVKSHSTDEVIEKHAANIKQNIEMALKEIRSLSHQLAPVFFDDVTIKDSFELLIKSFNVSGNYNIQFHFDKELETTFINRQAHLNLYRILQEALKNIYKYSKSNQIKISLIFHDMDLVMDIQDNGIGFNLSDVKSGIGLGNMKRRAELFGGSLSIFSAIGEGCNVKVRLPLNQLQ